MGEEGFFEGKGVVSARRKGLEDALKALAKVPAKAWKDFATGMTVIKEFGEQGGFTSLLGGSVESVKEQVKTSVTGLFSPITNEINQFTADLLSESGLQGAFSKIGNSLGNLITTVAGPETGLGKAVNFIGNAVANTLDFAAKGWESLISGRNAFIAEFQETVLPTTGGGLLGGTGQGYFDGTPLDMDVLMGIIEDALKDQDLGF
jgi:hypothetical protein